MDLRQSKPVHMKCPKCGHDFSTNTNKIVQDLQFQRNRINQINRAIKDAKDKGLTKKSPQLKRLIQQREDCIQTLQALKAVNRNLAENAELEKYKVFVKLIKSQIGEEKTIKLLREAEEDIVYRDYDTAIQRHNNFEGA